MDPESRNIIPHIPHAEHRKPFVLASPLASETTHGDPNRKTGFAKTCEIFPVSRQQSRGGNMHALSSASFVMSKPERRFVYEIEVMECGPKGFVACSVCSLMCQQR